MGGGHFRAGRDRGRDHRAAGALLHQYHAERGPAPNHPHPEHNRQWRAAAHADAYAFADAFSVAVSDAVSERVTFSLGREAEQETFAVWPHNILEWQRELGD